MSSMCLKLSKRGREDSLDDVGMSKNTVKLAAIVSNRRLDVSSMVPTFK